MDEKNGQHSIPATSSPGRENSSVNENRDIKAPSSISTYPLLENREKSPITSEKPSFYKKIKQYWFLLLSCLSLLTAIGVSTYLIGMQSWSLVAAYNALSLQVFWSIAVLGGFGLLGLTICAVVKLVAYCRAPTIKTERPEETKGAKEAQQEKRKEQETMKPEKAEEEKKEQEEKEIESHQKDQGADMTDPKKEKGTGQNAKNEKQEKKQTEKKEEVSFAEFKKARCFVDGFFSQEMQFVTITRSKQASVRVEVNITQELSNFYNVLWPKNIPNELRERNDYLEMLKIGGEVQTNIMIIEKYYRSDGAKTCEEIVDTDPDYQRGKTTRKSFEKHKISVITQLNSNTRTEEKDKKDEEKAKEVSKDTKAEVERRGTSTELREELLGMYFGLLDLIEKDFVQKPNIGEEEKKALKTHLRTKIITFSHRDKIPEFRIQGRLRLPKTVNQNKAEEAKVYLEQMEEALIGKAQEIITKVGETIFSYGKTLLGGSNNFWELMKECIGRQELRESQAFQRGVASVPQIIKEIYKCDTESVDTAKEPEENQEQPAQQRNGHRTIDGALIATVQQHIDTAFGQTANSAAIRTEEAAKYLQDLLEETDSFDTRLKKLPEEIQKNSSSVYGSKLDEELQKMLQDIEEHRKVRKEIEKEDEERDKKLKASQEEKQKAKEEEQKAKEEEQKAKEEERKEREERILAQKQAKKYEMLLEACKKKFGEGILTDIPSDSTAPAILTASATSPATALSGSSASANADHNSVLTSSIATLSSTATVAATAAASATLSSSANVTSNSSSNSRFSSTQSMLAVSLQETLLQFLEKWQLAQAMQQSLQTTSAIARTEALKAEAKRWGFECTNVLGDGNCFFHAVEQQLKTQDAKAIYTYTHATLRQVVLQNIFDHLNEYKSFNDRPVDEWIGNLAQNGTWADDLMVVALSRTLNMTIAIARSDRATPTIIRQKDAKGVLYLGYEVGVHYQSLTPLVNNDLSGIKKLIEAAPFDQPIEAANNSARPQRH